MFKRTKLALTMGLIAVFSILTLTACMMPTEGADGEQQNPLQAMLPMILIVAVFYFVMIRPQNKKNKQTNEMRSAVKRGDWVTTIGGFRGKVSKVVDDLITIEVGKDKVKLEIMRWGISKIDDSPPDRKGTAKDQEEAVVEEAAEEEDQPKRKPKKLAPPKKDEAEEEGKDDE